MTKLAAAQLNRVSHAVVDHEGYITSVDLSWRALAESTDFTLPNFGVGASYLSYCLDNDQRIAVRSVSTGQRKLSSFTYPCPTPQQMRWFVAVCLPNQSGGGAMIMHIDISDWAIEAGYKGSQLAALKAPPAQWPVIGAAIDNQLSKTLTQALGIRDSVPSLRETNLIRKLSPRQFEVLRLLAEGRSNQSIAAELGCEISTIKQHVSAIFRALEVSSRTQAALYWRSVPNNDLRHR